MRRRREVSAGPEWIQECISRGRKFHTSGNDEATLTLILLSNQVCILQV